MEEIRKKIENLDISKTSCDIFIYLFTYLFIYLFLSIFNCLVSKSTTLSILIQAIITPDFKKGDRNLRDNYRPGSFLPRVQSWTKYMGANYSFHVK